MPTFPRKEPETIQLADEIIVGAPKDPIYADAPVTPAALQAAEDEYKTANGEMNDAYAVYLAASQRKSDKFAQLQDLMRRFLKFAENIPGITQAQLRLIGWDTRAAPTELETPGQCLEFELIGVAGHMYDFDWKKPKTGGKPALYELVIRAAGAGSWKLLANDTKRDLEEKVELDAGNWEIAVRAANDAGTGMESNAVAVSVA